MKHFFILWIGFALLTRMALAVDLTFSFESQVETVNECGLTFSRVKIIPSNPKIKIISRSVKFGQFQLSIPTAPQSDKSIKGVAGQNSLRVTQLSHPLYPDIPLVENGVDAFVNQPLPNPGGLTRLCRYLKRYHEFASIAPFQTDNSILNLKTQNGISQLTLKATTPVFYPYKELPNRNPTIQGFEHLIIYDPLYEAEAQRLRNYRNQIKNISYSISVQSLPGYNSKDPIPTECQGQRYEECYFDPRTMNLPGVSKEAVPSLYGFRNDIVAGTPYDRVSFIPGVLRAFIREFRKHNPLKSIVLMGDPRILPNLYNDEIEYWDPTGTTSADFYIANTGVIIDRWYHSPQALLTQQSDFWYAHPDLIIPNTHQITRSSRTYFLWPCIDGSSAKHYRPACLPGENVDNSFWVGDTSQLGWNVAYPHSVVFKDNFNGVDFDANTMTYPTHSDEIIGVGRINAEQYAGFPELTTTGNRKKDPGVNNYISKLIDWESKNHPIQDNQVVLTAHPLSDGDTAADIAKAGILNAFHINSLQYFYTLNGDTTSSSFQALANTPEKFNWFISGHGGNGGVQGPSDLVGFEVPNRFKYSKDLGPTTTSTDTDAQLLVAGTSGTYYAGFLLADSCDISGYRQLNSHYLMDAAEYQATTVCMAEHLISGVGLGIGAATYVNYNVGWRGPENYIVGAIYEELKNSYDACENIGRAYARIQLRLKDFYGVNNGSFSYSYEQKNKVLMGDPHATLHKGCAPPIGPINSNLLTK